MIKIVLLQPTCKQKGEAKLHCMTDRWSDRSNRANKDNSSSSSKCDSHSIADYFNEKKNNEKIKSLSTTLSTEKYNVQHL